MGTIKGKLSLLLGLAVLVFSTAPSRPARAASPHTETQRSPAPATVTAVAPAAKRARGPLRIVLPSASAARVPALPAFQQRLRRATPAEVAGLYLDDGTALHVVQQPADDPAYVSAVPGTVTQFRLAAEAGTLGFLAHIEAAGASFATLEPGDLVWVVYGGGRAEPFAVREIQRYRAEEGSNPYSDFFDLDTGDHLSAAELFQRVYGSGHDLVLQTCLQGDGSLTWGRLFVLAEPVG